MPARSISLALDKNIMTSRFLFAYAFVPFAILIGEIISRQGKKVVAHAFGEESAVGSAISLLLRIGFYLVAFGLLLWNLGISDTNPYQHVTRTMGDEFTEASLRLGIAIFVVGFLHGFNILALSLFHRKNRG